jgi:uncharacterized membrane protein YedE/YeeE
MFEYIIKYVGEEAFISITALSIGLIYGFIAQRKQFCFSGSIKDMILFKHTKRATSLLLAMLTAIVTTQLLTYSFDIDLTDTRYFTSTNYLFIIIGGAMFGYGMMMCDGCSGRHLIKFAQGSKNSLYIMISLGVFSYLTYTNLPILRKLLLQNGILDTIRVEEVLQLPIYIPILILIFLLYKSVKTMKSLLECYDGILIGLIITLGWYVTNVFEEDVFLSVASQSFSFVGPTGKLSEFVLTGFNTNALTFGVWVLLGVLTGAFISAKTDKKYSLKNMSCAQSCVANPPKPYEQIIGGAFMGVGGILAVGCTVGQGLSGLSTLSLASCLAVISIFVSGLLTAKYLQKRDGLIACFIFEFKN